ncbi:MAG: MBL fold metallo-hydrolase [Candidatus Hodarchaeota archaeon]
MTTKVVLLGTGTPNPDPRKAGPSVAVIVDESVYLVDFGPGVVRRAMEAGLRCPQLTLAFLTHLHSDHTVGYPDLIFTPAVMNRNGPLNVHGPRGIQSMTDHIFSAYREDIRERIEGLEPAVPEAYAVNVNEIPDDGTKILFQDDTVSVEAFPVVHGSWPAFGFKFATPDKTIVISGDTAPSSNLIEKSKNCDILVHEVYSAVALESRPSNWKKYHTSVHTSTIELADIARQVKPKLLVLYHQLTGSQTNEGLLSEVTERYDGDIVSGEDLDVF